MASGRGGDVNSTPIAPIEPLRSPAASPDRLSERDGLDDSLEDDLDKKKKSEDVFAKPKIGGSRQVCLLYFIYTFIY